MDDGAAQPPGFEQHRTDLPCCLPADPYLTPFTLKSRVPFGSSWHEAAGNRTYPPGALYPYHVANEVRMREGVLFTYEDPFG